MTERDPARAWDGPLRPGGEPPAEHRVETGGVSLAGESMGEGPPIVLLHGLTAARRYVVHGSKLLPRRGLRAITYDARGHGRSSAPPSGQGYDYSELTDDLGAVLDALAPEQPVVLAGHSMGAHTATAFALREPDRVAGLVAIGPSSRGVQVEGETLAEWDKLAASLEQGGVEGFLESIGAGQDEAWRERILGFTRERMSAHSDLEAVARALRAVPRSIPFEGPAELEFLDVPALVVASQDEADPGHPYAVAEEWAERLPNARLLSEPEGTSPLAWQGGRLSREIASFCGEQGVKARFGR